MNIYGKIIVYGAILVAVAVGIYWLFQTFTYTPPKDTTPIVPPTSTHHLTPEEIKQAEYCNNHLCTKGGVPIAE